MKRSRALCALPARTCAERETRSSNDEGDQAAHSSVATRDRCAGASTLPGAKRPRPLSPAGLPTLPASHGTHT
eukprot:4678845-Pleurochrysis_carterae.AAC.1